MKNILLVDGNSIAWRAFHVAGFLTSGKGDSTGVPFVFMKMLRGVISQFEINRCIVAWDGGLPVFRLNVFPEYKRKRRIYKSNDDKAHQAEQRAWFNKGLSILQTDLLPKLGVHQGLLPHWEADDLIALWSLVRRTANVFILSGDRDLWQLVHDRVSVISPSTHKPITLESFKKDTDFDSPDHWLLYRILTGDGSDGISGIGGVGVVKGREMATEIIIESEGSSCSWTEAFRHVGVSLYGIDWMEKRVDLFTRNSVLMDLRVAIQTLRRELSALNHPMTMSPPIKDFPGAMQAIERLGMYTIVAEYQRWIEPWLQLE